MADTVRKGLRSFLRITSASDTTITISEGVNYLTDCAKNRIWYWGKSKQLQELYGSLDVQKTMFWKARPTAGQEIQKIHVAIPALMVDVITNILKTDFNGIEIHNNNTTEYEEVWEKIQKENNFADVLESAIKDLAIVGDGAFKISFDNEISELPIIEWYGAEKVKYTYVRGRIREIKFYTEYTEKTRCYQFEETYGYGYIKYALYDNNGREVDLHTVSALSWIDSEGITFDKSYMWAVPLIYSNGFYEGRGKGIISNKEDAFDSIDEIWSQWMDASRSARTKTYMSDCYIPRNPETGEPIAPNPFDNRYIAIGNDMTEGVGNKIVTESPSIQHESYLSAYVTALDLCLQGVISPSTLGIDNKKLDNAEAQREKEKTTLYTRQNFVKLLEKSLPSLVKSVLNAYYELTNKALVPADLDVAINFREYANPSFESQVETVGKARQSAIMSVETSVEKLYGDSKCADWKAEEVKRIKEEQGITTLDETSGIDDLNTVLNNG